MKAIGAAAIMLTLAAAHAPRAAAAGAAFGEEVAFLQRHTPLLVLADPGSRAKIAVAPAWQGRVMTSTAAGDAGASFGWINRDLIAAGQRQAHINIWGGEDRFWIGPEGGQFSIFFAPGVPFDLEHWFTPAALDTEPFAVVGQSATEARFAARFALTNYSGAKFDVRVERTVRLLDPATAWRRLGAKPDDGVSLVVYESANRLFNAGRDPWRKERGLLSIWMLGMFKPSPGTTIVVPLKPGAVSVLGPAVTSDYFGQVPPERLVVRESAVFFSGDGRFRSKIGINPRRSKGVLGSYDARNQVLTLVQFTQPAGVTDYVNSLWKLQDDPYGGDAANSYNDGPATPGGKPFGPFYELESSSPAALLAPGRSLEHVHRTFHLVGPAAGLDRVAQATLGVPLADIARALPQEEVR